MSSNANASNISDLWKRIGFTFLMLAVCRLGIYVPIAGVDKVALENLVNKGAFGLMNLFSGGAIQQASIFALGVMPYITASIVFQLLTVSIPYFKSLQDDGDAGRQKINQYTRYLSVVIALFQASMIASGLVGSQYVLPTASGISFVFTAAVTIAAGSLLLMWVGEQISDRGIGNGISLVIFSGIISRLPIGFHEAWINRDDYLGFPGFILLLVFMFSLVAAVIFFERCHRRIPIHYAKRMVGNKMYQGQASYLPLKINMSGVVPAIFASALLMFPQTIGALTTEPGLLKNVSDFFNLSWVHTTVYVVAIVFFTFFYTAIVFDPDDFSENLQKNGGYIPGIRPGRSTSEYLNKILGRVTVGGALYLVLICILPQFLIGYMHIPGDLAYTFGGTSVLIMVGVAIDTIAQIDSHRLSKNYDNFLGGKAGKFKGRKA